MIDPSKKYRCSNEMWIAPTIYEYTEAHAYGRVGFIPIAWNRSDGSIAECPARYGDTGLNLIEVKPEVTVRKGVFFDGTHIYCGVGEASEIAPKIGAIDITHNGDRIIKVEIVNDYAPGAMR